MKATIAWWNLDRSEQTINSLRENLKKEEIDSWQKIPGLRLKFWISDSNNNLWGAVMLWEAEHYMSQSLPPNRAMELIGYPPTHRIVFDVEATTEKEFHAQYYEKLELV